MSLEATGPNAEQIHYWNDVVGPGWVATQELVDAQIAPLGLETAVRGRVATGDRVLDVGCGCGDTLLQLGERVGRGGAVLGVDLSAVMLARATERVAEADLPHVRIENADAQTRRFELRASDVVFSRFGLMFFADPVVAFANLRAALAPGGRLAFVCWQALDRNPWMLVPAVAAAAHVTLPPPPEPGAPGPFSLASRDRVQGILDAAGFETVGFGSVERELLIGGGAALDRVVEFCLEMGPLGAALRLARRRGEAVDDDALRADVRAALAPYAGAKGVRMPSASWIVTAENPGV